MMKNVLLGMLVAVTVAAAAPWPAAAEEMSRTQADAILTELRQIRLLLEKLSLASPGAAVEPGLPAAANGRIGVSLGTSAALGRADAPVTVVEFTDYQCPFCRQFHVASFERLKRQFIETGKLRYVSRDLPLAGHPHAQAAAHTARCAGDQNKFWEMRHVLLVNAAHLGPDKYVTFAQDLNLDVDDFRACMASGKHTTGIQHDFSDAQAAGITGTPTFVLGRTAGDGVEGEKIVGAQPYAVFEAKLKELLISKHEKGEPR